MGMAVSKDLGVTTCLLCIARDFQMIGIAFITPPRSNVFNVNSCPTSMVTSSDFFSSSTLTALSVNGRLVGGK